VGNQYAAVGVERDDEAILRVASQPGEAGANTTRWRAFCKESIEQFQFMQFQGGQVEPQPPFVVIASRSVALQFQVEEDRCPRASANTFSSSSGSSGSHRCSISSKGFGSRDASRSACR
jgi:hypothetical protein